ncbi:MAG: M56 family metallopeptidase, partial [Planctomycetota bacterium]
LVLVAAVVTLALKNRSAHVRYLLWLIVLAKCLVPPVHTIGLAVLPERKQPEAAATIPAEMPPIAVTVRAVPTESVTLPPVPIVHQPVTKSNILKRLARLSLQQWLVLGWGVGVIGFILIAVTKALRVNAWLRRERRALPAKLKKAVENMFDGLDVKTGPKVWLVEGIGQPFVWGLLRGDIYLPGNFAKLDRNENRRNVLGHELSHVLRFDAAVNVLQIIAQAIFWFHPFVWWANKKIRAEREKCCDEMAIARLGAKAKDYGSAIVNTLIAEHKAVMPIPSLAVAGPVKNIEDRIKTIMNPRRKFYQRPSFITVAAVLLLAAVAVPTTLALTRRAQKEATKSSQLLRERDRLLAEADAQIRQGLLELAERFPQLSHLRRGRNRQWLMSPSEAGHINVALSHPPPPKAQPRYGVPFRESERFGIRVTVRPRPSEIPQMALLPIYPNLELVGHVGVSAGDANLEAALEKLVKDALEPLQRFNDRADGWESNAGGEVSEAWGEAVNGLRCRWLAVTKEIQAGAPPMVGMEVENVSDESIFWQCREGTWLIRHPQAAPGTPAGTSPRFELSLGEGVREATTEEAQRHHEGAGSAIGYYVLGPGAKIAITAPYPYPLVESGLVEVEGFLHRENPGGGGAYFQGQVLRNVMTCPPLVLEVVGGVKRPVIEGLSISVACAEERVKTADELELVVTVENKSGAEVKLYHGALEDDFPIVVLDMASQESGPHVLWARESGYGTGLVSKALKNNENKSKTIQVSDCWRWYGGRPILSPGRYRVKAKVTSLTAAGQFVESESEPIWVTILEWPWGEALQGVQVRLRAAKAMFEAGEPVSLKADIYNGGRREVFGQQTKHGICRLQLDNQFYLWGGGRILGPPIKPGGQVEGIAVPLDNTWVGEDKMNLTPGKHVIRVYFVAPQGKDDRGLTALVVSNPVEITIIADQRAGESDVPRSEGSPYPVPWWQAGRAGEPNSAVQIESRFIVVPAADANEMGEFLQEVEDSEIASLWAEPNVKHYLLEGEETRQLLKKLREGDLNCGMTLTTAPRLTVLSGQSATISIQTQTVIAARPPVISNILPKLGAECRTFEPTIPTGTTLSVTPIVNENKKDILLSLSLQMNSFLGMKSYIMKMPLPDGTVAEYEQELPQVETTSVHTRVSVPDGRTLLLAGQKIKTTSRQTRVSVPDGGTLLLGGQKVKKQDEQDGQVVEKELLILINAKIVEVDPNDTGSMGIPMMGYGGYGGAYGPGGYGGYGP